jgi:phosphate-selective porin OprO/OprP
MQENFDEENIKFSQRSESKFNREKYISEKIKNVDVLSRKNIELYYQYFEYVLQAEASEVELDARKGLYRFQSYYLQGSYFLYGSLNKYKLSEATLSKVKVYKGGAVELASRYSYLDLKDGGEQEDYNFGVNYYFNNEIRFMLNYIISKPTNTENYDGLLQLIQARVQIAF